MEPGETCLKIVDVGDDTDESHRNGPEDDHDADKGSRESPSDKVLSGLDAKISPHDFLRQDTELASGKL
jgi:hypothetical protein